MSFDKSYPNRKDHRKPYRKSKRFDSSCRNHGSCGYCQSNRRHATEQRIAAAESTRGREDEASVF